MNVFDVLKLILGISLFLFGMNIMSDSLKKSMGNGLKGFLSKATSSKTKGFLLGGAVTAVIQSSSAVTVMIVGFVNSGAMLLSQAVGVIMGANVGTAITSWITGLSGLEGGAGLGNALSWFKPSTFTPILALIGIILFMAAKSNVKKSVGVILLGFSVLMLGMDTMSDAVSGLSENETFRSILLKFENPLLGLLAGMILTAIIQSSSASIGILQSLTATGAITYGNAIPIIMGQNIGTCITALIASVGASKNAKRASVIHLSFNVIGSALGMGVLLLLRYVFAAPFLSNSMNMWGIAIVHTVFNLLAVAVLFPMSKILERIACLVVRDKNEYEDKFERLDDRLLVTPTVAATRAKELTAEMGALSLDALRLSFEMLKSEYDSQKAAKIGKIEENVDKYEDYIGGYFVKISARSISDRDNREIGAYLHMLGDIERICDHAENLCESSKEMKDKHASLPEHISDELSLLLGATEEICDCALNGNSMDRVEALENVIDDLCFNIKRKSIDILQKNECNTAQSFILNDILTDLERIGDHSVNIAECMREVRTGAAELRLHGAAHENDAEFIKLQNNYFEKYGLK